MDVDELLLPADVLGRSVCEVLRPYTFHASPLGAASLVYAVEHRPWLRRVGVRDDAPRRMLARAWAKLALTSGRPHESLRPGGWEDAVRAYGDAVGRAEVEFLRRHGVLDAERARRLAAVTDGRGYLEAYERPRPGIHAAELVGYAVDAVSADALLNACDGDSGPLGEATAEARERARRALEDAARRPEWQRRFLLTWPLAVAAAALDDDLAALRLRLVDGGALDRHRALLSALGLAAAAPRVQVVEEDWLCVATGEPVSPTGGCYVREWSTLFVTVEVARAAVDGVDAVLLHELVHVSQPGPRDERSELGVALCEGATEALVRRLVEARDIAASGTGTGTYDREVTLVEGLVELAAGHLDLPTVAAVAGMDDEARNAYLSHRFAGAAPERAAALQRMWARSRGRPDAMLAAARRASVRRVATP